MRKIILFSAAVFIFSGVHSQQARKLDQPMQTKSCNIQITANAFVAKTFVELEYYNPNNYEIEGLQHFSLKPGQLISAFQLDLYGQYREGSIEERWKASNAYNSVVAKRIDPALLQMTRPDNYRLNIYPFAPKTSRKVTFTIIEILKQTDKGFLYELPINFLDSVGKLKVDINVNGENMNPETLNGLLRFYSFINKEQVASLHYEASNKKIRDSIRFIIPFKTNQYQYLSEKIGDSTFFSIRMAHDVPKYYYASSGDRLAVFWDISASGELRNIDKEIHFLHSYIASNKITEIDLYAFNQQVEYLGKFDYSKNGFSPIRNRINNFTYRGSTNLSSIDFSKLKANTALVFSDGIETRGGKEILNVNCQVSFIVSSKNADYSSARKMTERNGGSIIHLNSYKTDSALRRASQLENMLYEVTAGEKPASVNKALPIRDERILLSGQGTGNLKLRFGNHLRTAAEYSLWPNINSDSTLPVYDIIQLVEKYEYLNRWSSGYEVLLFGLENKIVTSYTSFIVLERIEDYIRFKIAPPKELEEQCKALNYVYNPTYKRKQLLQSSKETIINDHVVSLNKKTAWWSSITSNKETNNIAGIEKDTDLIRGYASAGNNSNTISTTNNPGVNGFFAQQITGRDNTIAEVVVTSAFNTRRSARSTSSNAQFIGTEQLNVVQHTNLNNALAGKVAGIQVRSQSAAKLGALSDIRIRGENSFTTSKPAIVVDGTIVPDANSVNVEDIDHVVVLQGPNAAALYGPDASNGAIVVNLKKGRRNYYGYYYRSYPQKYKLSQMPDIDYVAAIKKTEKDMFMHKYLELKKEYAAYQNFYFDMAEIFHEYKLKEDAYAIMEDAIEMTNADPNGLYAAAYIFESWGDYDKAIELYQQILSKHSGRLEVVRDLALCYFRHKNYQLALNTYYEGITFLNSEKEYEPVMSHMINEINALIAVHKDQLDISAIDPRIIRNFSADLYISTENNIGIYSHFNIDAPGNKNFAKLVLNERNENVYINNNKEMIIYKSEKGKYKIMEYAIDNYHNYNTGPRYHRIVTFKNFQRPDQSIEILTVNMTGQSGKVEVGSVSW